MYECDTEKYEELRLTNTTVICRECAAIISTINAVFDLKKKYIVCINCVEDK